MNITINIVEAASELAHKKLIDLYDFDDIYNGEVYSDEAQKTFDNFYDEYYNLLIELHTI
jgi:hypothetical protein